MKQVCPKCGCITFNVDEDCDEYGYGSVSLKCAGCGEVSSVNCTMHGASTDLSNQVISAISTGPGDSALRVEKEFEEKQRHMAASNEYK